MNKRTDILFSSAFHRAPKVPKVPAEYTALTITFLRVTVRERGKEHDLPR